MAKNLVAIGAITCCFLLAISVVWEESLKHLIPQRNTVSHTRDPLKLPFLSDQPSISYLHFFDEKCLNSRVNITHLSRLTNKHRSAANFYLINMSNLHGAELRKKYNIPDYFSIVNDADGRIAAICGITTTPYALVVSSEVGNFYGNYNNESGLCGSSDIIYSAPATALNFLIKNKQIPLIPSFQTVQQGCEISSI